VPLRRYVSLDLRVECIVPAGEEIHPVNVETNLPKGYRVRLGRQRAILLERGQVLDLLPIEHLRNDVSFFKDWN
jgi:hypothetical protein